MSDERFQSLETLAASQGSALQAATWERGGKTTMGFTLTNEFGVCTTSATSMQSSMSCTAIGGG
jgi:hypothetical protein